MAPTKCPGTFTKNKITNDNFSTPQEYWDLLQTIINLPPNQKILDPYFFNGEALPRLKKAFNSTKVIHKNVDFYSQTNFDDVDYIITNPPYSCMSTVLDKLKSTEKPFAILIPMSCLMRKYMRTLDVDNKLTVMPLKPRKWPGYEHNFAIPLCFIIYGFDLKKQLYFETW